MNSTEKEPGVGDESTAPLSGKVKPDGENTGSRFRQYLVTFVVCISNFSFGMNIGWLAPIQPVLQSEETHLSGILSDEDFSWLGSLSFIGGMMGTLLWGRIGNSTGRKQWGYCIAVPFVIGWSLILFPPYFPLLCLGRLFLGLGGSGTFIFSPVYISEIADDDIRGSLGSSVVFFVNVGVVTAYSLGAFLPYHIFTVCCAAPILVFIVTFVFVPETPHYLLKKGLIGKAEDSIAWLRGRDSKSSVLNLSVLTKQRPQESLSIRDLIKTKGRRRAMVIGFGLFTFQQFSGIFVILSYTVYILEKCGSTLSPAKATIIVGISQVFGSYISSMTVERVGRKLLLITSYFTMCVALLTTGMYFEYLLTRGMFGWIPVSALSLYSAAYALGAGPLAYVMTCETQPPDVKALAASFFVLQATFLTFVAVKMFPYLMHTFGFSGGLWFYGTCCFFGFLFTMTCVPETKGLSVSEILAKLNGERTSLVEGGKIEHN